MGFSSSKTQKLSQSSWPLHKERPDLLLFCRGLCALEEVQKHNGRGGSLWSLLSSTKMDPTRFTFLECYIVIFFYVSKKWKHFVSYKKKEIFLYCAPLTDHIRGILRIE